MGNELFPALRGLTWNFKLYPLMNVLVQESVSGREVRSPLWAIPKFQVTLTYDIVRSDPRFKVTSVQGVYTEFETLLGFFLARGGAFDSFLLNLSDLTHQLSDSQAVGQPIGVGSGGTTQFPLVKNIGGYLMPIQNPAGQKAAVYLNGVVQAASTYSIQNGIVVFNSPPGNGVRVTATFLALLRVRFHTGEITSTRTISNTDPEFIANFLNIWGVGQIDLMTVKN